MPEARQNFYVRFVHKVATLHSPTSANWDDSAWKSVMECWCSCPQRDHNNGTHRAECKNVDSQNNEPPPPGCKLPAGFGVHKNGVTGHLLFGCLFKKCFQRQFCWICSVVQGDEGALDSLQTCLNVVVKATR